MKRKIVLVLCVLLSATTQAVICSFTSSPNTLRFSSPAAEWIEGLPVGNGKSASWHTACRARKPFVLTPIRFSVANGKLLLFPGIPEEWKKEGSLKGLRLPGNREISFSWKDGVISDVSEKSCK